MRKKASLSLSINAIVILVLAITMLGLGLGFTKGMFGKLSSKLTVPEPDIPATADEPIVLPTENLNIQKNKDYIFSVNVYNDDFIGAVSGSLKCNEKPPARSLDVTSASQEITPGEDKGFKFIIEKDQVSQAATRVCTLTFTGAEGGEESKQVVVSIR